uniref:Uncharacterized protein n=1 Tax=Anguilla anguilla TaxID=7936 RepID=A0A0E9WBR3_ANGAN
MTVMGALMTTVSQGLGLRYPKDSVSYSTVSPSLHWSQSKDCLLLAHQHHCQQQLPTKFSQEISHPSNVTTTNV